MTLVIVTWVYLMRTKSELYSTPFCELIETQFKVNIKCIRIDNVEFDMKELYVKKGVIHQKPCVETSRQNGVVE